MRYALGQLNAGVSSLQLPMSLPTGQAATLKVTWELGIKSRFLKSPVEVNAES